MPPPQPSNDPRIAALERAFAAHLDRQPGTNKRRRFPPLTLWHYKCYCAGYSAAPPVDRTYSDYNSARRNYALRAAAEEDADGIGAIEDGGEGGDLGQLWSRASGPDKTPRRVVSTAGIVRAVMREHVALSHGGWGETWARVARRYTGILKDDVQWVVQHCPTCGDKSPGAVVRRASTRLAAFARSHLNAADDSQERAADADLTSDTLLFSTCTATLNSSRNGKPSAELRLESRRTPVAGRGGTAAANNEDNAVASRVNDTAVATFASTIVPFDQIRLAVTKKTAAGRSGTLHWLVCICDVASAYSALHAIERLHAADIAETVAHWIKSFSQRPTIVRWSDAGGGSPALRRDLAVRLRMHGVFHVTELAAADGRDAGAGVAPSVPRVEKMCRMGDTDCSATMECSTFSIVIFGTARWLSTASWG
jgi:hypothetical protein